MSKKATTLLVPECDLHLPLAQRRFPYRAASVCQVGEEKTQMERRQVNQAISLVIDSVRQMIWRLVMESSSARPSHEVEDLVANTLSHICIDSLPRYDQSKGIKVSTFIYACASRYIFRNYNKRGLNAMSLHDIECDRNSNLYTAATVSIGIEDPEINHALRIIRNPADYLDPLHARVISEYANGVPVKTIAQHITKSRASVHRIFRSACARIRKLSESAELREYAT